MMMVGRCADGGQAVCWALSQGAQHNSFAKTGLLHYISAINQDLAAACRLKDSNIDYPALPLVLLQRFHTNTVIIFSA